MQQLGMRLNIPEEVRGALAPAYQGSWLWLPS
jgi:hypothetical protein